MAAVGVGGGEGAPPGQIRRSRDPESGQGGAANNNPDGSPGIRSGNNGQVQLWQFLLELLTVKEHRGVIQWLGEDGEFKLNNPEIVAQLWGS